MTYDVFITFMNTVPETDKYTPDRKLAYRLYQKLTSEGLNVFCNDSDMNDHDAVDKAFAALDNSDLMVVVGSCSDYVSSKWLKSQWTNYFGAINSGRKPKGKIITLLDGITTHALPLQLANLESFRSDDLDSCVKYIFKTLGKISKSDVQEYEDRMRLQREREAEAARLAEIKRQMEEQPSKTPADRISRKKKIELANSVRAERQELQKTTSIEPEQEKADGATVTELQHTSPSKSRSIATIAVFAVLAILVALGVHSLRGTKPDPDTINNTPVQPVSSSELISSVTDVTVTTEDQQDDSKKCEYLNASAEYVVGDHLLFGSYEQDVNTDNGSEPIEWCILDITDDGMLMISEYVLDCKRYNDIRRNYEWGDSTLRTWLNEDFADSAFNENERIKLCSSDGKKHGGSKDYVFCLEESDLSDYFKFGERQNDFEKHEKQARPTPYAIQNGCDPSIGNGKVEWWLCDSDGKCVTWRGYTKKVGNRFGDVKLGVRPVIIVKP